MPSAGCAAQAVSGRIAPHLRERALNARRQNATLGGSRKGTGKDMSKPLAIVLTAAGAALLVAASIVGTHLYDTQGTSQSPGTPAATQAARPASTAPASPLSFTCRMGWVNPPSAAGAPAQDKKFRLTKPTPAPGYSLANYEAMQVTVRVGQTETVGNFPIVWYRASGQEISSGMVPIGQRITAGQGQSFLYDESATSTLHPPAGATSCKIIP